MLVASVFFIISGSVDLCTVHYTSTYPSKIKNVLVFYSPAGLHILLQNKQAIKFFYNRLFLFVLIRVAGQLFLSKARAIHIVVRYVPVFKVLRKTRRNDRVPDESGMHILPSCLDPLSDLSDLRRGVRCTFTRLCQSASIRQSNPIPGP